MSSFPGPGLSSFPGWYCIITAKPAMLARSLLLGQACSFDIIVKTKLGFPRDWHKIMTGLWSALTPKLCGQQFHLQKELSH